MQAIKRLKNKTITIVLSAVIALSLLLSAFTFIMPRGVAHAETEDFEDFAPTSLGLGNTDFESSSGSYPASPSSWTGSVVGGGSEPDTMKRGVIDLNPSSYFGTETGNKKYKLDIYPEYEEETSIPTTIFGSSSKLGLGGDEKTLMINTGHKDAEIAYAYRSGDMSFLPNSFYRVSVWVKTGNFAPETGATVKLSGLGQNCSFLNINTVKNFPTDSKGVPIVDEYKGWDKYTFYVRSSASLTKTVNLVLGIGDALEHNDEDPKDVLPGVASGYAFFDTVKAERISAHDFAHATQYFTVTERSNVYKNSFGNELAIDLNETKSFAVGDDDIGTFSDNVSEWKTNIAYDEYSEDKPYAGSATSYIYNTEFDLDIDSDYNVYGFTSNPRTPYGRAEYTVPDHPMFAGTNANIMVISTYDGKEFKNAAYGLASPSVTIERFKYYRFSVWVKGDSVTGGNGISVMLKGKPSYAQKETRLNEYTGLTGDSSDNAHYGWKEQIFYIKGSMLTDYTMHFELWLGSPTSQSAGIAMFDNVTFTEIGYTKFSEMSNTDGGSVYTIDSSISNDTGVTNGNFMTVGDFDEIKFPLPVAEWTYLTPDTVGTRGGFSDKEVNTDNAVYGILPTDEETFAKISGSHVIPGVSNPADMYKPLYNVLLLSSTTPTAFCYQSPSITLSIDRANKLTVDMAVENVTVGKGAALVLKTTDGDIISTIENIGPTDGFHTFTFYLAAPLVDQTVYLEIWLGLNDRFDNTQKLSNGNIYVREVALTEWTAADGSTVEKEYADRLAQYKEDILSAAARENLDYGIFSFSAPSFDYYDFYSYVDGDGLGILYQWTSDTYDESTSVSGMFNAMSRKENVPYKGFDRKDLTTNMLYIHNTASNRTAYTFDNSLTFVANMYYRIDVTVKVLIPKEERDNKNTIGANIKLTGTGAEFANIKDTSKLVSKDEASRDYEAFRTYTFYIATGDTGGTVGLEISLGGKDAASRIQGQLVVGDISMTEIENLDYEAAEKDGDDYTTTVKLSETSANTDNTQSEEASSEIQWWVIPTVIFSAALIAVIIIIVVVRVRDRMKRNRKVTYSSEYSRDDVMRDIERLQAQKELDEAATAQKPVQDRDELDDYDEIEKEQSETADETETDGENVESRKEASDVTDDLDD
ncbi:MAG: hypothetical protein J1G01_05470 [Clostridiales bacterium]|nr:hypothetical protein [Clostridiales bacterium]